LQRDLQEAIQETSAEVREVTQTSAKTVWSPSETRALNSIERFEK